MQRLSNYKNYVIAISVLVFPGKPWKASFAISERGTGFDMTVIHTGLLERTFAYGGDARTAAMQAARAYIDQLQ